MKRSFDLFSVIFLNLLALSIFAQPQIDLDTVATGFNRPVDIAHAGDGSDRLFVVEKEGYIRIIEQDNNNNVLATPFLDISTLVDDASNEQGLLGLAFHPNYSTNGYFYVNYTRDPGPGLDRTVVARYRVSSGNANIANPSSALTIIEIEQDFSNHNGGDINFGPDGYLYIGMGDGGSGGDPNCRGQDPNELLGKMLRIDVDGTSGGANDLCGLVTNYGIPADNPFAASDGICDEIWSLGMRNPWRFSFDSQTGDMWIADVGQNSQEEIDFIASGTAGGVNFGWKVMEGDNCHDPDPIDPDCPNNTSSCGSASYTDPVFAYGHGSGGGCSVTGGYVYRGSQFPTMTGYYLFVDYCTSRFWSLIPDGSGGWLDDSAVLSGFGNITTFGEDENGELYVANDQSDENGTVFLVMDANALPVELIDFNGQHHHDMNVLEWRIASFDNFSHFTIQRSSDGKDFEAIGELKPTESELLNGYFQFEDRSGAEQSWYYRLEMTDMDQSKRYSNVIQINNVSEPEVIIYPNPVSTRLHVLMPENHRGAAVLKFYNTSGELALQHHFASCEEGVEVDCSQLPKGIYLLTADLGGQVVHHKLIVE